MKKNSLSNLFNQKTEKNVLVNQILSGNVFMTAEDDRPIKIKDMDILSNRDKLQRLIWNKCVDVRKLYVDSTNCIVSEVYLDDKSLSELLAE